MSIVLNEWLTLTSNCDDHPKYFIEPDYSRGGLRQDGIKITTETKEQKVVRLLKGDFEKYTGMSYEEFDEIHKRLIENYPEKLI